MLPDGLLTVKMAAERLSVSEALVYSWCASGLLPNYRMGRKGKRGKILIDPDELEGFMVAMKVPGAVDRPDIPPSPGRPKPRRGAGKGIDLW